MKKFDKISAETILTLQRIGKQKERMGKRILDKEAKYGEERRRGLRRKENAEMGKLRALPLT